MAAGDWKRWLGQVRVESVGKPKSFVTAYPLAPDRVLTSYDAVDGKKVRVCFWRRGPEEWLDATLIWPLEDADKSLRQFDVAILQVQGAGAECPLPPGPELDLATEDPWETDGFPRAAYEEGAQGLEAPAPPLKGKLAWLPLPEGDAVLGLHVASHPPEPEACRGLSGAPVVSRGRLVGFLKRWPEEWTGRLQATPFSALWDLPGFRDAIGEEGVKALYRRFTAELELELGRILSPHAWLREGLVRELGLEASPEDVAELVEQFLATDTLAAAEVLYYLHHDVRTGKILAGDRLIIEELVVTALPQLDVTTGALEAALAARQGSCVVFGVRTPVVAELAVARLSGRVVHLRAAEGNLLVPTEVPLPESPEIGDDGFKEAFRVSLAKKIGVSVPSRDGLDAARRKSRDQDLDERIQARLKVRAQTRGRDRISYFCVVNHDPHGPALDEARRRWLATTYPRLYFLELVGKDKDELDIVEWLGQIFAARREGGR